MARSTMERPRVGTAAQVRPAGPCGDGGAVQELRRLVRELDSWLPDPADGEAWARFDQAMGDLHRALVLLEAPAEPAEHGAGRPWNGAITSADGPPVPPR